MRKKLLYLVAMVGSFAFTTNAQECDSLALTVGGGSYASEVSWDITADGNIVAEGLAGDATVCLEAGAYSFNMHDSYGDGWNGNTFTLSEGEAVIATGTLESGAEGSVDFVYGDVVIAGCTDATATNYNPLATEDDGSCIAVVEGCTDETATNYNADANTDDGSCTYPYACAEGELLLSMVDSYGDSWNGSELVINDVSYTVAEGSNAEGCVADGCLIVSTIEGSYMSEASWTLTNEAGEEIAASGLPFNGTIGECTIPGCTDAEALNYDANATEDDGSCEYYSCDATEYTITLNDSYGDGWNGNVLTIGDESFTLESGSVAFELICLADGVYTVTNGGGSFGSEVSWSIGDALSGGSPFEGSLVVGDVVITGCMDETALNYDANATEDDGSCEYYSCDGTTVTIAVDGGSYQSEVSWSMGDIAGGAPYSEVACLTDGLYTFNMVDSYGDGWNGNVATISDEAGNVIAEGTIDSGDAGSFDFWIGTPNYTCNEAAAIEGGSASSNTDDNAWHSFEMAADGSADVSVDAVSDFGVSAMVYADCEGTAADLSALAAGTYYVNVTQDVPEAEVAGSEYTLSLSISILGCTDAGAANYDASATVDDGSCEYILGCTDPIAENYDETATTEDGSCEYIHGCTDDAALNYEPSATMDDGSCIYVECGGTSATMNLNIASYGSEVGATIANTNGQMLINIEQGTLSSNTDYVYDLCLSADSTYQIIMTDSYGDGWNGGTFSITTCEGVYTSAEGGLASGMSVDTIEFTVTACSEFIFGCTDPIAENFDANANTDDGSCEYIYGCTDANAINFDATATMDDDSCVLPVVCEEGTGFVFEMYDSYGDGWNGNTYSIADSEGNVVAEGTIESGSEATDEVCLVDGCFFITVGGGSYPGEVSWEMLDNHNGAVVLEGGAPASETYAINGDCNIVEGCMDEFATNYNEDANMEDGSCEYLTSEDCDAPIALTSGVQYPGSMGEQVFFSITLEEAGFLTVDAQAAPGSWYSPSISIITDCADQFGSVVEAGAVEAGTYIIKAEFSSWQLGYDYLITANVAPIVEGCMDVYAANYDETANVPTETCEYPCEGVSTNLVVNTVSYGTEVYWELLDDAGTIVATGGADNSYSSNSSYEVPLCLSLDATYTMNSYDTYGDGWNGGTYSFVATCGEGESEFNYVAANNGGATPDDTESTSVGGYHLEASESFQLVACDAIVPGCMDETMFNYNPEANANDGSCIEVVYGCMDSTMFNYNAEANTDDESCEAFVYGCTNANAINYNAEANTDDGSCDFGCDGQYVTVNVTTGSWATEVSWELLNAAGDTLMYGADLVNQTEYVEEICLQVGDSLTFAAHDSYGDGWNGGTFSISYCDGAAEISDAPTGYGADYEFTLISCDDIVYGCTNVNASNYSADATHSDGSCTYDVPGYVSPVDGATIDLATADSTIFEWETLYSDAGAETYYYVYFSTDADDLAGSVIINGSSDTTSMVVYDELYNIFVDNGYGPGSDFTLNWWVSSEYYNDTIFDGSNVLTLTLSALNGCMDEGAFNYNADATVDDGTCTYPCDTTSATLIMTDSYGDGWNGNELVINDSTYTVSTTDNDGESLMVCIDLDLDGCISFAWNSGSYINETAWTLYDASANVLAEGAQGSTPDFIGECVLGCTDDSYAEYNADATIDDGSCETLLCEGTVATLTVGGGSWATEVSWDLGDNNGGAGEFDLCLLDGCYTLFMHDSYGDGWNGNTAVLVDADGNELLNATLDSGAEGEANFALNAECEFAVPGCMDVSAANYNPEATEDDGSCEYEGCTDPDADNYNEDATIDDGSCMYSCAEGEAQVDILVTTDTYASETGFTLTDEEGGVYSVAFTSDNNTSTVTTTFCVANGSDLTFVLSDSYGDGIIGGGYEIYVCEESIYTDFNLGQFTAVSYEFTATCGDILGCMDPEALNFDEDATADDGSCEYPMVCNDVLATIVVSTADYASEMGWSLEDADGNQVAGIEESYVNDTDYSYEVCLVEGADYNFNMADSYGDGWNGGTFAITSECGELASGGLETGEADQVTFTASCDGGSGSETCEVPSSWDVTVTGANHTIMIAADALVTVEDMPVADGSAVGVFFTNSNGDLQCAGYAYLNGETVQIAAMGDDTTTPEVDGLAAGEVFTWMIWDAAMCEEWNAVATYAPGSSDAYTTNAITAVATISNVPAGPSCQTIDLPSGWSMFSTYMIAEDMDLKEVLAPIVDNVIIAKDNNGSAYLVAWDFNGVGDMQVGQGYQIKTDAAVSLEICGAYAFPEENTIELTAGWNMIGYLRTEPAPADAVLESVNASGNLIIAKDYNGSAYLPAWEFNGIGDMVPGQGYQLKTEIADVLTFNANDVAYQRLASSEVIENNVVNFNKAVVTDNNMTVVIEDAAWDVVPAEGSEIAAFDKAGNMIGSAVYSSPVTVLTVWGDDATTSSKDGLEVAEAVSFKVWSNGETRDFEVAEWAEGSSSYNVDAINVAAAIATVDADELTMNLFEAVPNPTNANTKISFFTPENAFVNIKVYNVLGDVVKVLADANFNAGYHTVEMNASDLEAGAYFYNMTSGEFTTTKRLNVVK